MNETIEAVQRMQDYIKENISQEITLTQLSLVSMYSPWYSSRLFKDHTGYSPAAYIRRLRLSLSALRLRDDNCRVIDAAFDMGFDSVDGYQRAFFREFGCNPKEYAKNPVPIYLFTPFGVKYNIKEKEQNAMSNVKNVFIQVIEKPARKVIVKRGIKANDYWSYGNEVGCDVWGLLKSIKSISGEPVCMWLPVKYRKPGTSEYVQGTEVSDDYNGIVPEGFDIMELPACKYLMFQGEPFREEDFMDAIDQVQQSIEKYDPSVIGYTYDDENPRIQLEPVGTRGYIEMLAVKSK